MQSHAVPQSLKRKRENADKMDDLYESMKRLKTDDEITKRILLVVHYLTQVNQERNCDIIVGTDGNVTFRQIN